MRIRALNAFLCRCMPQGGTAPIYAETVSVQHGEEIDLAPFQCTDLPQESRLDRVCYDGASKYLLVRMDQTYRHYCGMEAGTVTRFLAFPSIDHFFETVIEDQFGCRPENIPKYQTPQPPSALSTQPERKIPLSSSSEQTLSPAVDD